MAETFVPLYVFQIKLANNPKAQCLHNDLWWCVCRACLQAGGQRVSHKQYTTHPRAITGWIIRWQS